VRVGPLGFESAKQRLIDPLRLHFQSRQIVIDALELRDVQFFGRSEPMQKVIIRVPASTSNLGPGFDCLGVALRIYNDMTLTRGVKSRLPRIVNQAANLFFKHARERPFSFSCSVVEKIPQSRGLGSSGAIRVGVLQALNHLAKNSVDRLSIFHLCAQLEGHPDNAAPASFGGFTVVRDQNVQRFDVSPRLYFVLLIPDFEVATSKARKILPSQIAHAGAVESCANACAITAAFALRNYESLRGAFADHLHQPFRQKLTPFLPRVIRAAERAGALGGFLSGSGSTIAAVTLHSPKKIAEAMLRAARSISAGTIITIADNRGARLV
jgi:homoserine kinase